MILAALLLSLLLAACWAWAQILNIHEMPENDECDPLS